MQRWPGIARPGRDLDGHRPLVLRRNDPLRPMHLDPLVIPIGRPPRVGNDRHFPRSRLQHHLDRVAVPRLADGRVHQHRRHRRDFRHFLAQQEPGHVEVMDRHVPENPARPFDIVDRRRAGVAAGDRHHLDGSNAALVDLAPDGGEMRVEAAVEADHQHPLLRADDLQALLDARQRQVDGLLAEHRLPGLHELLDQVGMSVGRRADHHRVDVLRCRDGINRPHLATILVGNRLRRRSHRVRHCHQLGRRVPRHRLGMNLPDASCAQKPESDRHGLSLFKARHSLRQCLCRFYETKQQALQDDQA